MSVSIRIKDDSFYPFAVTPAPKQSFLRKWSRLTRLQRSAIYLLAIGISSLLFYKYVELDGKKEVTQQTSITTVKPPAINPMDVVIDNNLPSLEQEINKDELQADPKHQHAKVTLPVNGQGEKNMEIKPVTTVARKPDESQGHGENKVSDNKARLAAVVNAFKHSWSAYKEFAWGKDELMPISKGANTWFDLGLTLVDSLDTMYIMGLHKEFEEAKAWVKESLTFSDKGDVNLFETTIRVLGGLLGAYHLSKDQVFLDKAIDLGDRLLPCFSSSSGVPYSDVNLGSGTPHEPRWGPDSSTSEVTTIQLEFNDLSDLTGNPKYKEAVRKVRLQVHNQPKKEGLVPIFINAQTGLFRDSSHITLGARGDSYYEYLLKEWIQTGKSDQILVDDYLAAMNGVKNHLLKQSKPRGLWFLGELLNGRSFSPKMDHLVAFISGTLALGAKHGLVAEHLEMAQKLIVTFYEMYKQMPAKLSPEIAFFSMQEGAVNDILVKPADSHNLQRPETLESLYYLYWITGDRKYQDWAWEIFEAFENRSKISTGGYCSLVSVKVERPVCRDKMESFWLGETLKYFYLLFSDKNLFPFDEWVINTEGHALPILKKTS